jgi:hypothetical protein
MNIKTDKMYEHLENKRVAIVGPASSLKDSGNGEYIDSFDFVVRLNYAKTNNIKDTGTKTNIIYYDGSYKPYSNLDYLVCTYPETEWFFNERCLKNVNYYNKRFNHRVIDSNLYHNLKLNLHKGNKVRPNSGLVAIVDLLQSKLSKLYITGIDFYRTAYLKSHPDYGKMELDQIITTFNKGDNGDVHDVNAQFNYFKNIVLKDTRIEIDNFMKKFV